MQWQLLFFAVAPVVAYVALRSDADPRRGIGAAAITAALELAYNSFAIEAIEPFSLLSFTLFGLLGGLALQYEDERIFKLQPAALDLVVAVIFIYAVWVQGVPLLAVIVDDYIHLGELLPAYQRGYATVYATTLSRSLPFLLLVHAALGGWAAWRSSLWMWLAVRTVGFYGMLALLFLIERVLGVTP